MEVRYGGSGEMAAQLLEEGQGTEADVFFSQDAGALGSVGAQGRLAELPADVLGMVPQNYRHATRSWVATSARARVIAYDPAVVQGRVSCPKTIEDVRRSEVEGQGRLRPTNASWQAFVTSVRVLKGEDFAKDWLKKFAANDPKRYDKQHQQSSRPSTRASSLFGLINHYYWYALGRGEGWRGRHERRGCTASAVVIRSRWSTWPASGSSKGSNQSEAAQKAGRFLLSEQAQRHFADQTAEYPANPDIKPRQAQAAADHGPAGAGHRPLPAVVAAGDRETVEEAGSKDRTRQQGPWPLL